MGDTDNLIALTVQREQDGVIDILIALTVQREQDGGHGHFDCPHSAERTGWGTLTF